MKRLPCPWLPCVCPSVWRTAPAVAQDNGRPAVSAGAAACAGPRRTRRCIWQLRARTPLRWRTRARLARWCMCPPGSTRAGGPLVLALHGGGGSAEHGPTMRGTASSASQTVRALWWPFPTATAVFRGASPPGTRAAAAAMPATATPTTWVFCGRWWLQLNAWFHLDANRIYATGMSNDGAPTAWLARPPTCLRRWPRWRALRRWRPVGLRGPSRCCTSTPETTRMCVVQRGRAPMRFARCQQGDGFRVGARNRGPLV